MSEDSKKSKWARLKVVVAEIFNRKIDPDLPTCRICNKQSKGYLLDRNTNTVKCYDCFWNQKEG